MFKRILRYPLPDQIKAFLEKIEATDPIDTRSHSRLLTTINAVSLTWYERRLVLHAYTKLKRAHDLNIIIMDVLNATGEAESSLNETLRKKIIIRPVPRV